MTLRQHRMIGKSTLEIGALQREGAASHAPGSSLELARRCGMTEGRLASGLAPRSGRLPWAPARRLCLGRCPYRADL